MKVRRILWPYLQVHFKQYILIYYIHYLFLEQLKLCMFLSTVKIKQYKKFLSLYVCIWFTSLCLFTAFKWPGRCSTSAALLLFHLMVSFGKRNELHESAFCCYYSLPKTPTKSIPKISDLPHLRIAPSTNKFFTERGVSQSRRRDCIIMFLWYCRCLLVNLTTVELL